MDDIYAIRRKNLSDLCGTRADNNQSQMGRDLGKAPSLINRYIGGSKPIGDDIAREVEAAYGLERGWLDNRQPTSREQLLLAAFRQADDSVRKAVERALGIPFEEIQLQQALSEEGGASRTAPY